MEDEYREVVREFYKIYEPLRKKYHLRDHMHFSIYEWEDELIEIWEYEGEKRGKCICRAREKTDIECWKRATELLKSYAIEKEGKEGKRNAVMAS